MAKRKNLKGLKWAMKSASNARLVHLLKKNAFIPGAPRRSYQALCDKGSWTSSVSSRFTADTPRCEKCTKIYEKLLWQPVGEAIRSAVRLLQWVDSTDSCHVGEYERAYYLMGVADSKVVEFTPGQARKAVRTWLGKKAKED